MTPSDAQPAADQAVAAACEHDEHAGCGGAYEVRDGRRVLVERTAEALPLAAIGGPLLAASTHDDEAAERIPPLFVAVNRAALEPTQNVLS